MRKLNLITAEPEDSLYDEFFYAGGFIVGTTPSDF